MLATYIKKGSYYSLIFTFSSIASRLINFIFLPFFLTQLNPIQLGSLELFNITFSLATTIFCACTSTGLIRFFYHFSHDAYYQNICIFSSFFIALCLLSILSSSGIIFSYILFNNTSFTYMIRFGGCTIGLYVCFTLVTTYLRIQEHIGYFFICSISQSFISFLITYKALCYGFHEYAWLIGITGSCMLFLPFFFSIMQKHKAWNIHYYKQHFSYTLPLCLYGFFFSWFLSIDKFIIAQKDGLELVGIYGLLTRFGQLFQIAALSLMDAWAMIIYKIIHVKNFSYATRLITYYCFIITLGGLCTGLCMQLLIPFWLGDRYIFLVSYIPIYISSLVLLELARIFQTNFNLAYKTYWIPLLACLASCLQIMVFYLYHPATLHHILYLNTCIFSIYMVTSFIISKKIYPQKLYDQKRLSLILINFIGYIITVKYGHLNFFIINILILNFLILIWIILYEQEKESIKLWLAHKIYNLFTCQSLNHFTNKHIHVKNHSYSNNIYNQKILILGPTPPPYGGISIHIKRITALFKKQNNIVYHFDSTQRSRIFLWYISKLSFNIYQNRPTYIMYHTTYCSYAVPELYYLKLLSTLLGIKLYLIDHDPRYLDHIKKSTAILFSLLCTHVYQHVIIGNSTFNSYMRNYIFLNNNILIESSYLPPDSSQEQKIISNYPKDLLWFIENHKPTITVNAFSIASYYGKDLYGIDLCIELMQLLKKKFNKIGLVLSIIELTPRQHEHLKQAIINASLKENIYIYISNQEFWPIIKKCDLFIRPTRSDSLGISVGEAIFFNKPAIASNVCDRPSGTIIFQSDNIQDLYEKTYNQLNS